MFAMVLIVRSSLLQVVAYLVDFNSRIFRSRLKSAVNKRCTMYDNDKAKTVLIMIRQRIYHGDKVENV